MKIILDFDRVLFDHDALRLVMKKRGLEEFYAHSDLWDHISPADFLYEDAITFLESYEKESIVILSAYTARVGPDAEQYQTRKVFEAGIENLVSEIIIMDGAKSPYVCKYKNEKTFFVDDKRLYVEEVSKNCPEVSSVQLLRPDAERTKNDIEEQDKNLPILVVENLQQVDVIIKES